jgi:flavin reductase (DIM6/NTAB) family NADH-FMN oxidoreductase RutF
MAKKNIGKSFNIYPMPVVIVGTVTDGRPNFMTAAWVTKLNSDPPLVGLSLGRKQHQLPERRSGCARRLPGTRTRL